MCFDITGVIALVVYGSNHVRWYLSAAGGALGDRGSRVYVHRRMGSPEPRAALRKHGAAPKLGCSATTHTYT